MPRKRSADLYVEHVKACFAQWQQLDGGAVARLTRLCAEMWMERDGLQDKLRKAERTIARLKKEAKWRRSLS